MKPKPISDEKKRLRNSVVEVYKAYDRETRANLLQYVKEDLARLGITGNRKLDLSKGADYFDLPYKMDCPDDRPQNFRIRKIYMERDELYTVGEDTSDDAEWTFSEGELTTDDLLHILDTLGNVIANIQEGNLTLTRNIPPGEPNTWILERTGEKDDEPREPDKLRILVSHSGDPALDIISVPRYIIETEYEDDVELFLAALYGSTPLDEWKAGPYKGIPVRTLEFTEDDDAERFMAEHHDDKRSFL